MQREIEMAEWIVLLCAFSVWVVLILLAVFSDRKTYNNGYCKCGGAWNYFDTDSQGGDGYYCENCGKVIWISWIHPNRRAGDDG